MPQLLRPDEVAELLACSTRQVRYLAADGALPKVVLGHRTLRYRLGDVEALIARCLDTPVDDTRPVGEPGAVTTSAGLGRHAEP